MRDNRRLPARIEFLEDLGAAEHGIDGIDRGVLAGLIMNVLGVGDLIRLVPAPPFLRRYAKVV